MAGIEDERGRELVAKLVALQMEADALTRRGPSILSVREGRPIVPQASSSNNLTQPLRDSFSNRLNASSSVES